MLPILCKSANIYYNSTLTTKISDYTISQDMTLILQLLKPHIFCMKVQEVSTHKNIWKDPDTLTRLMPGF